MPYAVCRIPYPVSRIPYPVSRVQGTDFGLRISDFGFRTITYQAGEGTSNNPALFTAAAQRTRRKRVGISVLCIAAQRWVLIIGAVSGASLDDHFSCGQLAV